MAAQTIAEIILSRHSQKEVCAGDFTLCKVDFAFGQDGTSSIIIDRLKDLKIKSLKTDFSMVIDHNAPSPTPGASLIHKKMRSFADKTHSFLMDIGSGVCHQVIPEAGFATPGGLVLGADSHTCTYGALGCFASGVGSTDLAITLATGKNWFRVPQTIKIFISGRMPRGVFAKDIILFIIGDMKSDGATYKAIEFYGPVIKRLCMDGRFTICNMAVELGAKCAFMPQDEKTFSWLKSNGINISQLESIKAHPSAQYIMKKEYNVSNLEPQVACPHAVDNVAGVSALKNTKIAEAFIGTCTNGRLEDLKIAAKILKARKVKAGMRLIIAPASRKIFLAALKQGIISTLIDAGAAVVAPGCGPCVGTHCGVPADGERIISSANRNFKGRMGNPNAFIYLASPATVAASAIEGRITDPRKYL